MHDDQTGAPGGSGRARGRAGNRPGGGASGPDPGIDPRTRQRIGVALRAHYAGLMAAPIPDRFAALLAALEAAEPASGAARRGPPDQEDPR
ncbi:hypothetical protein OPKNFCMD_0151 [Methylobacterium crusticola]|uniref:Anti-sigma factor NepR domain-containing protein n=1 Tax=Methylobacterium crusticola TaxID=1697972 RepID=A0ABQ4QQ91_9HYPH|nr:NepR family anti-sigma factor [Methylobacterium crusticola]GJD47443.1 hypothetical protein OPKNFCMD_0151 [Methylobacterium crusticola]